MAVRIRLKKMGRKKRPFYRLVAIDSKKRRDGLEIERLGWYNPSSVDESFKFNEEYLLRSLSINSDLIIYWIFYLKHHLKYLPKKRQNHLNHIPIIFCFLLQFLYLLQID